MSASVALQVRLKIPDTTALSAEDILKRKMGYADRVERLEREDWWLFEVEADDPARARERVVEWAARCTALVNPNKHYSTVQVIGAWPPEGGGAGVRILVRDREDVRADSMLAFLRKSFGARDLAGLSSGTLWTLTAGPTETDARSLAAEITVLRSQAHGLLANPHAQVFEIWT